MAFKDISVYACSSEFWCGFVAGNFVRQIANARLLTCYSIWKIKYRLSN